MNKLGKKYTFFNTALKKLNPLDFGENATIVNPKNKVVQYSIVIENIPIDLTEVQLWIL